MSQAKVEIKLGTLSFSGEGDSTWLAQQLDKLLAKAPELARQLPHVRDDGGGKRHGGQAERAANGTLAGFLKAKNATKNQVKKFLATASWLQSGGKSMLTTSDVTKALRDSRQSKLGNAADCLNKNVAKGHCEKDGDGFFVTDDGTASL